MSMIDRVLAAVGLQFIQSEAESEVLNELAFCTTNHEQYMGTLHQAVEIAKAGGVQDDALYALLHLNATRCLTPDTVRVLTEAGIDTTHWRRL